MKTTKQTTTRSGFSIQDICSVAIMAALTAVRAQISIPMPMGVPMTMQTFAVTLAGVILGSKRGAVSMVVYLLIGSVGVPVFSNMGGGVQYLIGPTGGFLLSFPIMAYLIGLGVEKKKQKGMFSLFLVLGTVANYAVGVAMYCVLMDASVWTGITACVLPFIPTAVIKAVAAAILGLQVRSRLAAVLQTA